MQHGAAAESMTPKTQHIRSAQLTVLPGSLAAWLIASLHVVSLLDGPMSLSCLAHCCLLCRLFMLGNLLSSLMPVLALPVPLALPLRTDLMD